MRRTVLFAAIMMIFGSVLKSTSKEANAADFQSSETIWTVEGMDGELIEHAAKSLLDSVIFLGDYGSNSFTLNNNAYRTIRVGLYSSVRGNWDYIELGPYASWSHWSFGDWWQFSDGYDGNYIQLFVWNAAKQKWVGKDTALVGLEVINTFEAYKYAKRDYRIRMERVLR